MKCSWPVVGFPTLSVVFVDVTWEEVYIREEMSTVNWFMTVFGRPEVTLCG